MLPPRLHHFCLTGLIAGALTTAATSASAPPESHARVTNPSPALPVPPGPFEPTWASLENNYHAPAWFLDAKFGIFLHWGVYSVAARQSEWYPKHMYATPGIAAWHRAQFGPQDEVGYKDLIPLFTAEHFDPAAWAQLLRRSGAKYVMPVAEHHDGFALWDSDLTRWDAMDMGPHRDLIGELATAVRAEGLKFGVSYHRMEHWSFLWPMADLKTDLFDPAFADFYGHPQAPPASSEQMGDAEVMNGLSTPQSPAFLNEWLRRGQELIDKYAPDLIYFDNGVNGRGFDSIKLQFAAYYYNRAAAWGKAVSLATKGINAAAGPAYLAGTLLDFERGHPSDIRPGAWQTDTTVHSRWGYLEDTQYRSVGTLVHELIDNVSKGGNLLLNFAPRADGIFPPEQVAILLGIGAWLDVNGDAIYGTRPWTRFGEGPTGLNNPGHLPEAERIHREAVGDIPPPSYTKADFRFTTKGNTLYAIAMNSSPLGDWVITSLAGVSPDEVRLLGHDTPLTFTVQPDGLHVTPPSHLAHQPAYALALTGLPTLSTP